MYKLSDWVFFFIGLFALWVILSLIGLFIRYLRGDFTKLKEMQARVVTRLAVDSPASLLAISPSLASGLQQEFNSKRLPGLTAPEKAIFQANAYDTITLRGGSDQLTWKAMAMKLIASDRRLLLQTAKDVTFSIPYQDIRGCSLVEQKSVGLRVVAQYVIETEQGVAMTLTTPLAGRIPHKRNLKKLAVLDNAITRILADINTTRAAQNNA